LIREVGPVFPIALTYMKVDFFFSLFIFPLMLSEIRYVCEQERGEEISIGKKKEKDTSVVIVIFQL